MVVRLFHVEQTPDTGWCGGGIWKHVGVKTVEPHPLRTQAELERSAGDDPYVRYDACLLPGDVAYGWRDSVAVQRSSNFEGRPPSVAVFGPEGGAATELLGWIADGNGFPEVEALTVDEWLRPQLERRFRIGRGGDWDWMMTEHSPAPVPGEALLETLDDARDAGAIEALNLLASPTAESEPGSGKSVHWLGLRDGDRVVAAGAVHLSDTGHGVLCGIVVHPEFRGRGLGRAITAALTRFCVERDGLATLGVYRSNALAIDLYESLGYRTVHRFVSRRVEGRLPS